MNKQNVFIIIKNVKYAKSKISENTDAKVLRPDTQAETLPRPRGIDNDKTNELYSINKLRVLTSYALITDVAFTEVPTEEEVSRN